MSTIPWWQMHDPVNPAYATQPATATMTGVGATAVASPTTDRFRPTGPVFVGSPRMGYDPATGVASSSGSWLPPEAWDSADSMRLHEGIAGINGLFGNRDPIYGQVRDDVYGLQSNRLNENREETLRKLRFGLARTGLTAGSADIGAHGMEQRQYGRSLMDASSSAQQLADEVRANDEKTRLNLIAQMRAGLDQGNATQSALAQMTNNVNAARGANTYQAVDAYAAAMQPALAQYQIQQGTQQARRQYQPYRLAPGSTGTLISE